MFVCNCLFVFVVVIGHDVLLLFCVYMCVHAFGHVSMWGVVCFVLWLVVSCVLLLLCVDVCVFYICVVACSLLVARCVDVGVCHMVFPFVVACYVWLVVVSGGTVVLVLYQCFLLCVDVVCCWCLVCRCCVLQCVVV